MSDNEQAVSNIIDDDTQKNDQPKRNNKKSVQHINSINIAILQMQLLVGDIQGNVKKIKKMAIDAQEQGADIAIFPEMALLGYLPQDLLLSPSLASRVKSALTDIRQVTDIVIVLGYPHCTHHQTFNSIAVLHKGQQKGFYHKQYLPSHGVFDENRYFSQGHNQVLFDYKGATFGLLIAEDLQQTDSIKKLKKLDVDVVIVINASPFEINKHQQRKQVITECALAHQLSIIYVNAVGGQADLVFDGGSMVVQANGEIAHEAPRFLPDMLMTNYDTTHKTFRQQPKPPLLLSQSAEIYQALVVGLRDYVNHSGFGGVIVGLFGGIDSALSLCIAVDALGAENVYAVMLTDDKTAETTLEDTQQLADSLNVSYTVCSVVDTVNGLLQTLLPLVGQDVTEISSIEENIPARAKAMVLMALSNKFGHLVVTTSNKSDLAIGQPTLYGDMIGGFNALKDIYKSKVYELAHYRNRLEDTPVIPERIFIQLPPNKFEDDLTDYQLLDQILTLYIDDNVSYQKIVNQGFDATLTAQIIKMVDSNEYKRHQSAIGTKITHKSFGRERRYPLIHHWSLED